MLTFSAAASSGPILNILWLIEFEYESRLHHGNLIRFLNFAPELIAQGHIVTFAIYFVDADPRLGREHFDQLKSKGVFTDYEEIKLDTPAEWRNFVANRLLYPPLSRLLLHDFQDGMAARVSRMAIAHGANIIFISSFRLLFLQRKLNEDFPIILDIGDCHTLYYLRQLRVMVENFNLKGFLNNLKPCLLAYSREFYYGRLPLIKIMVSPVDKQAIDRITGRPETSTVVMNGVRDGAPRGKFAKIPGRIIFTGNMNFAPNYEAALWFLDHVFPLVIRDRRDVCLVIAGANPIPALLERASSNVVITGYVQDMSREIASSEIFIAPLVSGGGFKNKVAEAFVNRTYVVASSIAVEFLGPEVQSLLKIANTPEEMSAAIKAFWEDPTHGEASIEKIYQLIRKQFGWSGRATQVAALARSVLR